MYFIMHAPMQRLIIPDLWIPDSLQTQPVFLCVDDGIAFYKKRCKVFVENWRLKYNKFCYRDELFSDL